MQVSTWALLLFFLITCVPLWIRLSLRARQLLTLLFILLPASLSLAGCRDKEAVEIGFTLQDNLVRLPAQIDEQKATVVLDSGTSVLLLDKGFARWSGALQEKAVGNGLGGGQGAQTFYPAKIKSIRVGAFSALEPAAYAMDLGALSESAGFRIDALIGQPAFAERYIKIDYPKRRVKFGPIGEAAECAAPIPLKIVNGAPVAEVQFWPSAGTGPITLSMLVDLGTRHSLALIGGPFLKTDIGRQLLKSGKVQKLGTGVGAEIEGVSIQAQRLELGGHSIQDPQVSLSDQVKVFEAGVSDGSLGVPLWERGVITFDYAHETLCLEI